MTDLGYAAGEPHRKWLLTKISEIVPGAEGQSFSGFPHAKDSTGALVDNGDGFDDSPAMKQLSAASVVDCFADKKQSTALLVSNYHHSSNLIKNH